MGLACFEDLDFVFNTALNVIAFITLCIVTIVSQFCLLSHLRAYLRSLVKIMPFSGCCDFIFFFWLTSFALASSNSCFAWKSSSPHSAYCLHSTRRVSFRHHSALWNSPSCSALHQESGSAFLEHGVILYAKTVRLFGNFLQFCWKILPCKNCEVRAICEYFQLFGSALRRAVRVIKQGFELVPPLNSVGARKVTVSEGDGGLPWLSQIWTESIKIQKCPHDSGLNTRKSGLVNVCFLD